MKRLITLLFACLTCLNPSLMAQDDGEHQDNVEYKRITFMPASGDQLYLEYHHFCDTMGYIEWEDFIDQYHPWTFSFVDDTLCIKGVYTLNCITAIAECSIKNNVVDIKIWQEEDDDSLQPDCMYPRPIDLRFPGFEAGTYSIGLSGQEHKEAICYGKQETYIPFVEKGKRWRVLGFCVGPYSSINDYYFGDEEITVGEHTYLILNNGETCQDVGIYREEDKRVYLYDEGTKKEYCVYDFTLEVGDTFNIGIGNEADRCVVTKVGHVDVKGKKLRTITFSSIEPYTTYDGPLHENHTWVEGIGEQGKPTEGWIPNTNVSSWTYSLAYVTSSDYYLPFTIWGMWAGNYVMGQELVRGEEMSWEEYLQKGAPLYYGIKDGKVHVWGYMWLHPNSNNYVYCHLSPKDDFKTYTVSIENETVEPVPTNLTTPHAVDLYFDLPFPNFRDYDYVYVDEDGEHPIPNHDTYQPFVEEGKEWKVGVCQSGNSQVSELEYYRIEGDTIIDNQACKQWLRQFIDKSNRRTEYIGAVYEKDGKVYEFLPGRDYAVLLYDFTTPRGEWVEVYDASKDKMVECLILGKDTIVADGNYLHRTLVIPRPDSSVDFLQGTVWTEGIGNQKRPNSNSYTNVGEDPYQLISCVTANGGKQFTNSSLTENISQFWTGISGKQEDNKQKLDFTHVIKTRPTGYRTSALPSLLQGEYDDAMLSIDFLNLNGTYQITIFDPTGRVCYQQTMETVNLKSMDLNLSDYDDNTYIITVENEQELYSASFTLPWEGNSIKSILNTQGINHGPIYDLCGRRLPDSSPLPKGIYLHQGKKLIVRP